MPPNVTLILTVHNREQYLGDAIASVQAQTYPHYELILWDDGSGDSTGAIALCLEDYRAIAVSKSWADTGRGDRVVL